MELPFDIKDTGIKTTSPFGFILGIRVTEYPTKEVGILAIDPKELKEKRVTGVSIYFDKSDLPRFIEKLKEVV